MSFDTGKDRRERALIYARKGWRVFPITPGDKDPPIVKWQHGSDTGTNLRKRKATTDETTIRRWWEQWPTANVGAVCGPTSGFWALDVDGPKGEATLAALEREHGKLPKTREHKTPRKGRHLLFACDTSTPEIGNRVGFADGLDTRAGDKGYIVMPPSHTKKGENTVDGDYRLSRKRPIVKAPQWLLDLVKPSHDADVHESFKLPDTIEEGRRDVTIYKYACQLRHHGAAYDEILAAIRKAKCEPPLKDYELVVKAKSACKHEPGERDEAKLAELTGKAPSDAADYIDMNKHHRSLKDILEDDELVQNWIIKELFEEGSVVVIAGSPKTGKTIFALHNILHMKGAVPPLAEYEAVKGTKKLPVGYFNEMGEKQLKKKIQEVKPGITDAAIAEILGSIEIYNKMPILDTAGLKQFEAQIRKHKFRVFVIDTTMRVRPPMRGTDVATADGKFVDSIAQIARRTNCCIILLTQNNKPRGATESFTDRIGHTNQFLAAADDYISIYRKHDVDAEINRRRYMVAGGRNIKETDEVILTLNGDGLHIDGSTYMVNVTESQKAILECLRHTAPMTPKQIGKIIGKSRENVRNTVERLITKEKLIRIGQRGKVTTPEKALALRSKARREAL